MALIWNTALADHSSPDSISRFASGAPGSGIALYTDLIAESLWQNSRQHSSRLSTHHFGVAMASAGSGTNLQNLNDGRVEFAVVRADLALAARDRPDKFNLDLNAERIRLVAHLAPALVHILVRRDGIDAPTSLADLNHRSVSIGLPGDIAHHTLKNLIEAHGVNWRSLTLKNYPVSAAYPRLVNGQLDAIITIDQPDSPQLAALLRDEENRLLGLDPEVIKNAIRPSAQDNAYRVDSSTLKFGGQALSTMAIDMLLLAQETVAPESVDLVLKHIANAEEHANAFGTTEVAGQDGGFAIKLHPAAAAKRQPKALDEQAITTNTDSHSALAPAGEHN